MLVSNSQPDIDIGEIHKFLKNVFNIKTVKYDPDQVIDNCNCVFLSKNHGEFQEETSKLVDKALEKKANIKFIDLSADFRLKDISLYETWYHFKHTNADLLQKAVYGLPEVNYQKIKEAFFIANPGCYPTCTILSVAPLFVNNFVDANAGIIVDAISGVSGAGKKINGRNLAMDIESNIKAYKIGIHPHTPEIKQELEFLMQGKIKSVLLVPHVASFKYGMITTTYLNLSKKLSQDEILERYHDFYKEKPFIRIYKKGEYPEIQNVEGTNFCDIGIQLHEKTNTCIVIGCIDNVIKGAVGQAIQNMNIMFGLNETEGLPFADVLSKNLS